MNEFERQALLADQAAVRGMLENIPASDPLGRISFSSRLSTIDRRLAELANSPATIGSVALMFSGGAVSGSRSIDTAFATSVLQSFNDLVTTKVASEEYGTLGSRGRLPLRSEVNLTVTDMVRGSVGFILEEKALNLEIADTVVKLAIDDVAKIVVSTGGESDVDFESEMESLDHRSLVPLRMLFKALDDSNTSMRIVEGDRDAQLDTRAIARGRRRVDMIEINDQESEQVIGEVLGILPGARRFEMKLTGSGEVIKGTVAATVAPAYLSSIETPGQTPIVGRVWRAKMRIREITERNKPPRRLYTLIGLLEPLDSPAIG